MLRVPGQCLHPVTVFLSVHSQPCYSRAKTTPQIYCSLFLGFSWKWSKHITTFVFCEETGFSLWMHLSPCATCFFNSSRPGEPPFLPLSPSLVFSGGYSDAESPVFAFDWGSHYLLKRFHDKHFAKNLPNLLFSVTTRLLLWSVKWCPINLCKLNQLCVLRDSYSQHYH